MAFSKVVTALRETYRQFAAEHNVREKLTAATPIQKFMSIGFVMLLVWIVYKLVLSAILWIAGLGLLGVAGYFFVKYFDHFKKIDL